jgi:hypothetical protein
MIQIVSKLELMKGDYMERMCKNCIYAGVSKEGKLVCYFNPPKPMLVPEGTRMSLVEVCVEPKQIACHKFEPKVNK